MIFKVEDMSLISGRSVIDKWKVCHCKVEGLSLMSGRSVTDKWKTCHYGGRLVIMIYFNVDFLV